MYAIIDAEGWHGDHVGVYAVYATEEKERAAQALLADSRSPEAAHWPGVDAAALGYLLALLCGLGQARAELEAELADAGRAGALGGASPGDPVTLCRRACGVP